MDWFWPLWILGIAATFAAGEGYALATGRKTLSRWTWELSKAWPPYPCVFGMIVGTLATHFFWIAQGCDMASK
jgi:hypothetical protein